MNVIDREVEGKINNNTTINQDEVAVIYLYLLVLIVIIIILVKINTTIAPYS